MMGGGSKKIARNEFNLCCKGSDPGIYKNSIFPAFVPEINFRSYSNLLLKSKVYFSMNRLSSLLRFIVFATSAIIQKKKGIEKNLTIFCYFSLIIYPIHR